MTNRAEDALPPAEGEIFDAIVVGGGPAGATAADDLARKGYSVALLDRAGRIKPCGGAIPPRLIEDFDIPAHLLVARARAARIVAPSGRQIAMPIDGGGYVGMVDRDVFDEWLRERAGASGATRVTGRFRAFERDGDGNAVIRYEDAQHGFHHLTSRLVIGADGACSQVARQSVKESEAARSVFAYHEVVKAPEHQSDAYQGDRCDIHYRGDLSPDFYSWVFPHGETASIGTGSAVKGVALREKVRDLRRIAGLDEVETIRCEGAPIPLAPLKRWDNGRDVVLAGDAAGVVAPASGEGIYYAMLGGRLAADAAAETLASANGAKLSLARKHFMRDHGRVFWMLGMMQRFWYTTDKRRERFATMCADPDVQYLTWEAYMRKKLVRARPAAHARIFMRDMAHLLGIVAPQR